MTAPDFLTGFRFRVFLALIATAIIFLFIALYGHRVAAAIILRTVEASAAAITAETSAAVEESLHGAETVPLAIAKALEHGEIRETELLSLLRNFVAVSPRIYGAAAAFEPYEYDSRRRDFSPYFFESVSGVSLKWLGRKYDYRAKDWYQLAEKTGRPVWTEPYLDVGAGDVMMCSFVVPVYRIHDGRRIFRGVISADISLDWLNRRLPLAGAVTSSYAIIVSRSGRLIVHPRRELVLEKTIFDLATLGGENAYIELGRRMLAGERGFARLKSYTTDRPSWFYFAPIGSTGWSIALAAPQDELLEGIRDLEQRLAIFGGFTLLFFSVIILVVSRSVTRPLCQLSNATLRIAAGNLDEPLPETGGATEVVALRTCLEQMRHDLKLQMAALAEATAREERLASELRIGRNIQASFLPSSPPESEALEIYAALDPAREVAGDLYDYFLLDRDHLFFAIGDVSDKGVPAALFMAVTVTTIRALAQKGRRPAEILAAVNRELCRQNDELMFVTLLCGVLDLRNGVATLANAGHPLPVLRVENIPPVAVDIQPGLVLGIREEAEFADKEVVLPPAGVLVLFTDGVTEAVADDGTLLGMAGVLAVVAEVKDAAPAAVVRSLTEKARRHLSVSFDDVAVLALRYHGFKADVE